MIVASNAKPAVTVGDLATGGGISAGLTNVAIGDEVMREMMFGDDWSTADAAPTKQRMTRKPTTRWAWTADDYDEEKLGLSDDLVWIFR